MCLAKEELILQGGEQSKLLSSVSSREAYCSWRASRLIVSPLHTLKGQSVQRLEDTTERLAEELGDTGDWPVLIVTKKIFEGGLDATARDEEEATDVELGNRDISMVLEDEKDAMKMTKIEDGIFHLILTHQRLHIDNKFFSTKMETSITVED
ncbi:hypothetical protein CQW23_10773 [Capsicum baccatum]|uniref:Uncharacterized protein n=1 Tax=Capsicum baccatum TaxID=33114 RepID=A0A2G2X0K8_CAPBA|nr:hypothetical protein CQW23_10773 [Capsicum baccatum]